MLVTTLQGAAQAASGRSCGPTLMTAPKRWRSAATRRRRPRYQCRSESSSAVGLSINASENCPKQSSPPDVQLTPVKPVT